jgi:hypothetical protein
MPRSAVRPAKLPPAATRPKVAVRHGRLVRLVSPSQPAPSAAPVDADTQPDAPLAFRTRAAIILFVSCLFLPSVFFLGPIVLSPALLFLTLGFLPLLGIWASGRAGGRLATDMLVLACAAWAFVTRFVLLPFSEAVEPAGIVLLQTAGAFLAGRVLVRNAVATRLVFGTAIVGVILMMPFLIIESVTGAKPLLNAAALLGHTLLPTNMDPRWGFGRSQGVFEHPILLGMFVATLISPAILMFRKAPGHPVRAVAGPIVILSAMTSLSTGALLSMNIQFGLMLWNAALRKVRQRWTVLICLVVFLYVTADLLSDRTPFHLFVDYATFSAQSSYNRILIWQYGSAAVMDAPLLGHGTDDWERPAFMHASMDNFWLVIAYRYGLPAFLLLAGAFLLTIWRIARRSAGSVQEQNMRLAVNFSLIAIMIAAVSVHLWNNSYIWLMFMLGAVTWMTRASNEAAPTAVAAEEGHGPIAEGRQARLRRLGF